MAAAARMISDHTGLVEALRERVTFDPSEAYAAHAAEAEKRRGLLSTLPLSTGSY